MGPITEKRRVAFVEISLFHLISICTSKKERFTQACLFLFIALCPIQDFILQGTPLRSLGAGPSVFPLCAIAVMQGATYLLSAKMKVSLSVVICFAYILLTSVYGLLVFGAWSHGENLLWKGATSFISLAVVLYATQLRYGHDPVVPTAIYAAFTLFIIGYLLGNSNPLGLPSIVENSLLHFTPLPDVRPRGFASEASQFSMTGVALGLLSVHVTRSRVRKTFLFILTLGLLVASGSKGGILTLFLCAIILSLMHWHSKWYHLFLLIFVLFPLGLVLIWMIPNLFPEDSFAFSGTVPTRFSMIICALVTVAHNPFGVGLPGFLPAVAKYLPNAMSTLESIFPFPLNFSEVADYLTMSDMVSTKTFFFDQLMRFGIPFALFFFAFIINLLKRLVVKEKRILLIAILVSTIAIITFAPGTGNFAIPIVFGVALNEVSDGPDPLRC